MSKKIKLLVVFWVSILLLLTVAFYTTIFSGLMVQKNKQFFHKTNDITKRKEF